MNQIKKIQYNCRKATLLIEKQEIKRLSFREMIELRIHLAGCSVCRLYRTQSAMITLMAFQLFQTGLPKEHKLNDKVKQVMQQRINERLEK